MLDGSDILFALTVIICSFLVRLFLKNNGINNLFFIPYPTAVIIFGMVIGAFALTDNYLNSIGSLLDMSIDRVPGFYLFSSAFLFKTIFGMNWRIFYSEIVLILIVGVVGFFAIALLVGLFASYLCGAPLDDISRILLFGSILGMTDPGDLMLGLERLVFIRLETTLNSEALITTIVTFTIYGTVRRDYLEDLSPLPDTNGFYLIFLNIVVGYLIGKVLMVFLSNENCDVVTYICVSVTTGWLLFAIMEIYVSYGIIALIVFVLSISPHCWIQDVERNEIMLKFWEAMLMIANFLVCSFSGAVFIRDIGLREKWETLQKIALLYIFMTAVRILYYILALPVLNRVSSKLENEMVAVIAWGGLHSTASFGLLMCMIDMTYHTQFKLYGTGALFLNQLINGTTFRWLVIGFGFLEPSHLSSFERVVKGLEDEIRNEKRALYTNHIFLDADWSIVEQATSLNRAHAKCSETSEWQCEQCQDYLNALRTRRKSSLRTSLMKKILKIQKVSYARQQAQDLLSTEGYCILSAGLESAYHQQKCAINCEELDQYWTVDFMEYELQSFLLKLSDCDETEIDKFDHWFLALTRSLLWQWSIMATSVAQAILSLVEIFISSADDSKSECVLSTILTCLLLIQFLTAVFFCSESRQCSWVWSTLDCLLTLVSISHIVLRHMPNIPIETTNLLTGLKILRIVVLIRFPGLLMKTLPWFLSLLNKRIITRIQLGYDIGKSYILGIDEVLKLLPSIVPNSENFESLQAYLEEQRHTAYKAIDVLQKLWTIPVSQLKSEKCAIGLIGRMKDRVSRMDDCGFLEKEETKFLQDELKAMRASLKTILLQTTSKSVYSVLAQIPWLHNETEMVLLLANNAKVERSNEILIRDGEKPVGLHIVCSGLVACKYEPHPERLMQMRSVGVIPNVDYPNHLNFSVAQVDFVSVGAVLGEISLVTGRNFDYSARSICNNRSILFIPTEAFETIIDRVKPEIWKVISLKIARLLLSSSRHAEIWSPNEIQEQLDQSVIPDLTDIVSFDVKNLAKVFLLIEGIIMDTESDTLFFGPCIIPNEINHVLLPLSGNAIFPAETPTPRVLVIPKMSLEGIRIERTENREMLLVANGA